MGWNHPTTVVSGLFNDDSFTSPNVTDCRNQDLLKNNDYAGAKVF